ncbi:MAG: hypothetical protein E7536_01665 [Ruminococcaceae bacterium]|nr:hypothetical protein [Oscillospiraceae bacterium]
MDENLQNKSSSGYEGSDLNSGIPEANGFVSSQENTVAYISDSDISQPTAYQQPKKKKGLIIGIIAAVVVLLAGAAVCVFLFLCNDCKKAFSTTSYTDENGKTVKVCQSCYDDSICQECKEYASDLKSYENKDGDEVEVCEECFNKATCDVCEEFAEKFTTYTDEKGKEVSACAACYDKVHCSSCKEYVVKDDRKDYTEGGTTKMLCSDCYDLAAKVCDVCAEAFGASKIFSYEDNAGNSYTVCADCYDASTCDECGAYVASGAALCDDCKNVNNNQSEVLYCWYCDGRIDSSDSYKVDFEGDVYHISCYSEVFEPKYCWYCGEEIYEGSDFVVDIEGDVFHSDCYDVTYYPLFCGYCDEIIDDYDSYEIDVEGNVFHEDCYCELYDY